MDGSKVEVNGVRISVKNAKRLGRVSKGRENQDEPLTPDEHAMCAVVGYSIGGHFNATDQTSIARYFNVPDWIFTAYHASLGIISATATYPYIASQSETEAGRWGWLGYWSYLVGTHLYRLGYVAVTKKPKGGAGAESLAFRGARKILTPVYKYAIKPVTDITLVPLSNAIENAWDPVQRSFNQQANRVHFFAQPYLLNQFDAMDSVTDVLADRAGEYIDAMVETPFIQNDRGMDLAQIFR